MGSILCRGKSLFSWIFSPFLNITNVIKGIIAMEVNRFPQCKAFERALITEAIRFNGFTVQSTDLVLCEVHDHQNTWSIEQ